MYLQISGTNVRLLGSLHMVPSGEEQVSPWAREAYDWCEVLIVEHEPMSFLPFFKGGLALEDELPTDLFLSLRDIWPLDGPLTPLQQLRPWAALIGLAVLSQQTEEGIEPNFLRWAKQHQKPVQSLEKPSDVAAAFDSVPIEDIVRALSNALRDRSLMQKRLIDMHSAWLSQDPERLLAVASSMPLFAIPALRSVVLESRNRNWLPAIKALVGATRRTLVVVGALHLCGPGNVRQLLGESGHPVTPVG